MSWVQDIGNGSAVAELDESHALPAEAPNADPFPFLERAMDVPETIDLTRALVVYQQVMGLDAEAAPAMIQAARIQAEQGGYAAAEWLLRRSILVAPTVVAYNTLGHILLGRRQWDAAIGCHRASLGLDPANTTTWPNLLFDLDMDPWASWRLKLAERRRFNELHCKALTEAAPPHANDPDPERVLRVGYVSADFKQHSAAHGFGAVVRGHHADRVDLHLYDVDQSPPTADDRVSEHFRALAHATWHDVRGYDDATLAATIRGDAIDILVDLSGYSAGGRALMLARKPAPLIVTGFGYGTGLGIDAVDYLVADDVLIPPLHEARYHEKILRLPSFMGYEYALPWPDVGPPPKERNGYVTYGYLGRSIKISPQTLAAWAEILLRDPTAHLLFKGGEYKDETLVLQIRTALTALGVDGGRLEFRGGTPRWDHVSTYSDVDVSLDPFPHSGGVTTLESLVMGAPTITLLGDYVCGRTSASFLTTLGFKAAVARTPFEYIENALSTGQETWTLHDRQSLRRRLCASILMDEDAYASAAEDAYRSVWRTWCAAGRAS